MIKRMRRQATDGENLISKDVSDKGMLSKTYKELLKINNDKQTTQLKYEKIWTDTSPKKIYKWPISTREDARHHRSLRNSKLKRWHATNTPTGRAKIGNTDTIKSWQGCEATGTHIHCWWQCKMIHLLWKTVCHFLMKLKIFLPYHLAIPLLGIYTSE